MAGIKDKLWERRFRPWQACDTLMGSAVFQALIEQALLQVHTAFVGSVVRVNGNMATIQPLDMVKSAGGAAKKQAIIENCPVLQSAVKFTALNPAAVRSVQPGDTVFCVCAERNISETRNGAVAVPVSGHHELTDAVVVGIL